MIREVLALVATAAAPVGAASDLVPDGHQHEWIAMVSEPDNLAFFDLAYRGSADVEGKAYPVVLVRYQRGEPGAEKAIVDFRVAIDCEADAMSGVETYRMTGTVGDTGIRLGQREALSTPFTSVYPQNEARVAPLFKHACGPAWSMKAR